MNPLTIDGARAEAAYRREMLTRSYGARPRRVRRARRYWRLPAVLRAQPQLHLHLTHH